MHHKRILLSAFAFFSSLAFAACNIPVGVVDTTLTAYPAEFSNESAATFEFSSDQAKATFQCQIDQGAEFECSSPSRVPMVAEGSHTFRVKAILNGVEDPTPATYMWVVDLTPPDTTITVGPTPMMTAMTTDVTIEFTSTEANSTFKCKLDNETEVACQSGGRYSGLALGPHKFTVYAIDRAGNKDPQPAEVTWTVDATGPVVTITGGPSVGGTSGPDVTFTYTSKSMGVTFECTLDDAPFAVCDPMGRSYSGLIDGSMHTFQVRGIDPFGNVGPETVRDFTVDGKGPVINITSPVEGARVGGGVTFLWTSDETQGVTFVCTLDGKPVACAPAKPFQAMLGGGLHAFTVEATDLAGNSGSDSVTFEVDAMGPTVAIQSPFPGAVFMSRVPIQFSVTDPEAAMDPDFRCKLDDGPIFACVSPSTIDTTEGEHTFTVRATDSLGNVGPPARVTFSVR